MIGVISFGGGGCFTSLQLNSFMFSFCTGPGDCITPELVLYKQIDAYVFIYCLFPASAYPAKKKNGCRHVLCHLLLYSKDTWCNPNCMIAMVAFGIKVNRLENEIYKLAVFYICYYHQDLSVYNWLVKNA